ncbi:MaoC family dehydratase [Prosthecomicrobium sp. N25]|uniref:MaoC family dehydratase n=1 Tax=Prosthecomicrobium sp. N25 TaxID=3129254 RepID=UPI0030768E24
MKWYDDLEVGETCEMGSHTFEADEIVAYARQFDPQPFHLSDEGARNSLFGRLAASGWQTASVWMKLYVAANDRAAAALSARGEAVPEWGPSPGFEDMRWLKPVYAGDTLTYRSTVTGKRLSASRPGWGLLTQHHEAFNQAGEKVFEYTGNVFVRRRPA